MSEVKRYSLALMEAEPLFEDDEGDLVLFSDYEDLAEKLDKMESEISQLTETTFSQQQIMENLEVQRDDFQQRLVEAEKLLSAHVDNEEGFTFDHQLTYRTKGFLTSTARATRENTE